MDGLTQDGLAYCGFARAGASNADWPNREMNESGRESFRDVEETETANSLIECRDSLARTIEAEIIPRLMLLHRADARNDSSIDQPVDTQELEQTVQFCDLLLNAPMVKSAALIDSLIGASIPLDVLYLNLFGPAARRLGEMWEADLCSFADVTIGLGRLQQLMHSLSPAFRETADVHQDRSALLVGIPGEQHTLGLFMVSEFFRRAGWNVCNQPPSSRPELISFVSGQHFDVIGFSAGSVTRIDLIEAVIGEVRAASLNKNVVVLVGGPLFSVDPQLALAVGADAMAADARAALSVAEQLCSGQRMR